MWRTFEKLGDAELQLGHLAAAREAMKKAIGWRDQRFELLIVERSNEYEELGDICMQAGASETAGIAYEKALAVALERAKRDPGNGAAQHALVTCYERLGDANRRRYRRQIDAFGDYQKAVRIASELLQNDPSNRQTRRDLAVAHLRMADLNQENGDAAAARGEYRQALAGFRKLADDDPKNVAAQAELAYCYGECGYLQQAEEEFPSAIRCFEKGVAVLEKMRDNETLDSESKHDIWLEGQQTNLEICERSQLAIDNLGSALQQWPEDASHFLALRGRVFARHGRPADATAAAEKLAALDPQTAENLYNAAECYLFCLVHSTSPEAPPSPEAIARTKHDWSRVRELLQQAFDLWAAPKPSVMA